MMKSSLSSSSIPIDELHHVITEECNSNTGEEENQIQEIVKIVIFGAQPRNGVSALANSIVMSASSSSSSAAAAAAATQSPPQPFLSKRSATAVTKSASAYTCVNYCDSHQHRRKKLLVVIDVPGLSDFCRGGDDKEQEQTNAKNCKELENVLFALGDNLSSIPVSTFLIQVLSMAKPAMLETDFGVLESVLDFVDHHHYQPLPSWKQSILKSVLVVANHCPSTNDDDEAQKRQEREWNEVFSNCAPKLLHEDRFMCLPVISNPKKNDNNSSSKAPVSVLDWTSVGDAVLYKLLYHSLPLRGIKERKIENSLRELKVGTAMLRERIQQQRKENHEYLQSLKDREDEAKKSHEKTKKQIEGEIKQIDKQVEAVRDSASKASWVSALNIVLGGVTGGIGGAINNHNANRAPENEERSTRKDSSSRTAAASLLHRTTTWNSDNDPTIAGNIINNNDHDDTTNLPDCATRQMIMSLIDDAESTKEGTISSDDNNEASSAQKAFLMNFGEWQHSLLQEKFAQILSNQGREHYHHQEQEFTSAIFKRLGLEANSSSSSVSVSSSFSSSSSSPFTDQNDLRTSLLLSEIPYCLTDSKKNLHLGSTSRDRANKFLENHKQELRGYQVIESNQDVVVLAKTANNGGGAVDGKKIERIEICIRGTEFGMTKHAFRDLSNDILRPLLRGVVAGEEGSLGAHHHSNLDMTQSRRFQTIEKQVSELLEKYPDAIFGVNGHSLAGSVAVGLKNKFGDRIRFCDAYNPYGSTDSSDTSTSSNSPPRTATTTKRASTRIHHCPSDPLSSTYCKQIEMKSSAEGGNNEQIKVIKYEKLEWHQPIASHELKFFLTRISNK